MPTPQPAKLRRKRCLNDNKYFVPARNVPDQKFCCDACRKEYWQHGSAFGPMKLGLYAAIDKKYAALEPAIRLRFREAHAQMDMIERKVAALEKLAIDAAKRSAVEPAQPDARAR